MLTRISKVRMLDDWDFDDLHLHKKDGKSFVPK